MFDLAPIVYTDYLRKKNERDEYIRMIMLDHEKAMRGVGGNARITGPAVADDNNDLLLLIEDNPQ